MRPPIGILCSLTSGASDSPQNTCPHAYCRAVLAAGGAPVLIPYSEDPDATTTALSLVRAVLITGGVDVDPQAYGQEPQRALGEISPQRDEIDKVAVDFALRRPDLPVLGICRGVQALNAFAGGTLIQDIPSRVPEAVKHTQSAPNWHGTHSIAIEPGSVFASAVGEAPLMVNSFHHQAVDEPAEGFRIVARARDGVCEALEREGARFCVGVQFHPEHMVGRQDRLVALFSRFVDEAGGG